MSPGQIESTLCKTVQQYHLLFVFFFFLEDQNEGLILGIAGVLISFFAIIRSICNSILS